MCLKDFLPSSPRYSGTWKYCSKACHNERNRLDANKKWNKRAAAEKTRTVVCHACEEPFTTTHAQKRWCSRPCNLKGQILLRHGLDGASYREILERQNGNCASCGEPFGEGQTHIDHSHESGQVRGILHRECNIAAGHLKESVDRCLSLAAYLTADQFDLRDLCIK